jgi:putative protease
VEETLSDGATVVGVRNRLERGDALEFIGPGMTAFQHVLQEMADEEGKTLQTAHPNQRIRLSLPFPVRQYDIIRREKT